jgi:DNA gyrase inhibitor GyrI
MKKALIIIVLLLFALFTYLSSQGLLTDVEVHEQSMPGYSIMGFEHIGPYEKIGDAYQRISTVAGERGVAVNMIGVYFDDPNTVAKDSLRALAGLFVNSADSLKLSAVSGMTAMTIPAGNAAVCDFETNSTVSMIIGAMKCYPKLTEYAVQSQKAETIRYVYEVYGEGSTRYVMQFAD